MPSPSSPEVDPPAGARGPRRLTRLVVTAAVLAGLLGALGVWRHRPPVHFDGGYGLGVPRAVGQTVWAEVADGERAGTGEITIDRVEPLPGVPDGAEVEYVVCVLDPSAAGGFPIGGGDRTLERRCTSVRPAVGATLPLGPDRRAVLLMGVTKTRPGRVAVRATDLRFTRGWQRGQARLDVTVEVTARPAGGQTPAA